MKMNPKYDNAPARYAELKSIDAVAKEYGITRQAMHQILKLRGTQFEPRIRYGEDNVFYRGGSEAKDAAQNKMEKALIKGDLVRPDTCQRCQQKPKPFKDGRTAIQGHHYDYDKPLDVIWVCQKCHHEIHRETYLSKVQEVPQAEASPTKIDLVSAGFP